MCLVAFQKIFQKIFSGVWKRRRKTQIQKNTSHNPEKTQTQFKFFLSDLSPREIAINGLILLSRDRDQRRNLVKARSRSTDLPLGSRDLPRRIFLLDLSSARSREGEIAFVASPLARVRALSLSLSLIFRKCFEGKIEV